VLAEIGIEAGKGAPILEVWNKTDLLPPEEAAALNAQAERRADVVSISALSGEGVDQLKRAVADLLNKGNVLRSVTVDAADGAAIAWLHSRGEVVGTEEKDGKLAIDVRLSDAEWNRFQAR